MLLAKNRKALYNYELITKYMAGIQLFGFEVKAIREGRVSFEGSYIIVENGEVFVKGMYIGEYSKQSQGRKSYDPYRNRKLLLNKYEITRLQADINQKGMTAVPLALLLKSNLIKLEFAVVKGRSKYEKKVVAKEKQIKKDLEKQTKEFKWN